ncbi:MAG: transposase [Acidimicrobiaceae bacterium]|nr:transposase [Acidimicrobiaceae bacterium]
MGAKERTTGRVFAKHVENTTTVLLSEFVVSDVEPQATLITDGSAGYRYFDRLVVNHSVGEYVRGLTHTNGIESLSGLC